MQGKFNESLATFDKILAQAPKNTDALYNKAMVLWKIKKFDDASALFKEVLGLLEADNKTAAGNPLYQKNLYGLGELLAENKNWEESAFYLERYLELVKDDLTAHRLLVTDYRSLEKYAQVLEVYEHLLTLDANDGAAWLGKAEILLTKVADPINGMAALNKALMLGITKDNAQLKQLVDAPDLIEKDKVKALLAEKSKLTAH
jgi:tetratricopeptide (TPR) repeat protein